MTEFDRGRLNTSLVNPTFATTHIKDREMRDSMPYITFKPGECAERNWRKSVGCKYLALAIEGVNFVSVL